MAILHSGSGEYNVMENYEDDHSVGGDTDDAEDEMEENSLNSVDKNYTAIKNDALKVKLVNHELIAQDSQQ